MARFHPLLVLSLLLVCSGCLNDDVMNDRVQTLQERNRELRTETDRLQVENERLAEGLRVKEEQIRATTRLVHKMLDDLAAVSAGQGLVRGLGMNPKAQLAADFPQSTQAIQAAEAQFVQHLAAIESQLRDSEHQIERVRNSDRVPADALSNLSSTVERLRAALAEREARVASLQGTVDSLAGSVDALNVSNAALKTRNQQLAASNDRFRTTYYVVGTGEDLEARGIINERWLRPTEILPFDADRFETTTADATEIPLPDGHSAHILSLQKESSALYSVEDDALVIHDPAAFWARSKFLIIKTD